MPSEKDIGKFPFVYRELFAEAIADEPVELDCLSYSDARNMRNDLYAYRRALARSPSGIDHLFHRDAMRLMISIRVDRETKIYTVFFRRPQPNRHQTYTEALNHAD